MLIYAEPKSVASNDASLVSASLIVRILLFLSTAVTFLSEKPG